MSCSEKTGRLCPANACRTRALRAPGIFASLISFFLLAGHSAAWAQAADRRDRIILGKPPVVKPRGVTEEEARQDLLRKKRSREKISGGLYPKRKNKAQRNREELQKLSKNPGPLHLHLDLSFILPTVVTSGSYRQDYQTEPTAHFHIYFRPGDGDPIGNLAFWTGFRMAAFGGTGTYHGTAGRYGFLYYGPMFGIGKINPVPRASGSTKAVESDPDKTAYEDRTSWFLMSGVAMQARRGAYDQVKDYPEEDLSTKELAFDAPGIWVEFTYVDLAWNTIGTNYSFGLQTGVGKVFIYLGYGVSLWN